jgi:putative membrane protein insertion efficiency factor
MPSACKFYPSCSHYASEALRIHGARRGSWLALRRLSRCHPFTPGGVDLVPAAGDFPRGEKIRTSSRGEQGRIIDLSGVLADGSDFQQAETCPDEEARS